MLAALRRHSIFSHPAVAKFAYAGPEHGRCYTAERQEKDEWWAVDGELFKVQEFDPKKLLEPLPNLQLSNKRMRHERNSRLTRTRLKLKPFDQESYWKSYLLRYQIMRDDWERLYWDSPLEGNAIAASRGKGHRDIQRDASKGSREIRFLGRQFDRIGGPVSPLNDKVPLQRDWVEQRPYGSNRHTRPEQHLYGNQRHTWVKQPPPGNRGDTRMEQYLYGSQRDTRIEQHSFNNQRENGTLRRRVSEPYANMRSHDRTSNNGMPTRRSYEPYDNMHSQGRNNNETW